MRKIYLITSVVLTLLYVISCKKDRETTWQSELKGPLAKTSLSINDVLGTDFIVQNPDSTLYLSFSNVFSGLDVDDLFEVGDTVLDFGASLQSLNLDDISFEQEVTMIDLLKELAKTLTGFEALAINIAISSLEAGNTIVLPQLPGRSIANLYDEEIENSDLFESVTLEDGIFRFRIENNTNIDIENVQILIKNADDLGGEIIYQQTIASIPKKTVYEETISLAGQTIRGRIHVQLINVDIVEGTNVEISAEDGLSVSLNIENISPAVATAVWSAQDLIDTTFVSDLVGFNTSGIGIKEIYLRTGEIFIEAFSSLEDTLYVTYEVPNLVSAFGSGQKMVIQGKIPPAIGGNYGVTNQTISLQNYLFTLNGRGVDGMSPDTVNAFLQNLIARIQYTGNMVTITKSDTIMIKAGIRNMTPLKATGYFGEELISVGPNEIKIDVFDKVLSGNLQLDEVSVALNVKNGLGSSIKATLKSLQSVSATGTVVSVDLSGQDEIFVGAATDNNSFTNSVNYAQTQKVFNSVTTPNLKEFIENFPQKIRYAMDFEINHNLPVPDLGAIVANPPPNFAYYDHLVSGDVQIEVPLKLIADSLVLRDTMRFNYSGEIADAINTGNFGLVVSNCFPFNAFVSLVLMDENYQQLDTLILKGSIQKAVLQNGSKQTQKVLSFIPIRGDVSVINQLKQAKYIMAQIGFNTASQGNQKKYIYSHYRLDLTLTANVNYTLKN